jgi:predicted permease
MTSRSHPPRWLRAIIRACLPFEDRNVLLDELEALYVERAAAGQWRADLWYLRQAIGFALRLSADVVARAYALAASLSMEVRVAARTFRRRRAYAWAFVMTLGIGTGVVTTTYSVANWVMLRPVPGVRDPAPLVTMQLDMPTTPEFVSWEVSQPDYETVRDRLAGLGQVAGMARLDIDVRAGTGAPMRVAGELVTPNYFDVLGTRLLAGRAYGTREDAPASVVISTALASRIVDEPARAVGARIDINGAPHTVIGVAETGFRGAELPGRADLWLPVTALSVVDPSAEADAASRRGSTIWRRLIIRRTTNVTLGAVEAAANAALKATRTEFKEHSYNAATMRFHAFEGVGLDPGVRKSVRTTLRIIAATAMLLLLLAIANVSNLALANEATRGTLVGIQRALGATRGRIGIGRVIEGSLLGIVACVVSIALAAICRVVLETTRLTERGAALAGLQFDARVGVFTLGVALFAAAIAATVGATLTRKTDVTDLLRRGSTVGRASHRVRATLVGLQVALSLILLVVAGLLGKTVRNLRQIDLGFNPNGLATFAIDPRLHGLAGRQLQALLTEIETDLRNRGNTGAGFVAPHPLGSNYYTGALYAGPDSGTRAVIGAGYYVTPGFLDAVGARVIAGTREWRADSGTAVITRSMVDSLFPNVDPRNLVGRTFPTRLRGRGLVVIAAVIEDLRLSDVTRPPVPTIFKPLAAGARDLSVRGFARGNPASTNAESIHSAIAQRAPDIPVFDLRSARSLVDQQFAERTSMALAARMLALFGVVLAAVGLYGVLSTIVVARQRELAIRMALGATPADVRARVLRGGFVPVTGGIVAGTVGAIIAARGIGAQLYGLGGFDAMTYASIVALIVVVALAACLLPARRAVRVAPNEALKIE